VRHGCATVLAAALFAAAASGAPAPKEELQALRARLEALKKDIARSEGSRGEAADALESAEVAISDANRRLRELSAQRGEVQARLAELEVATRSLEQRLQTQRSAAAELVYEHYAGLGSPGPLALLLRSEDMNALARDRVYLEFVGKARKAALDALVRDVVALRQLQNESLEREAQIAGIAEGEAAEHSRLVGERGSRARTLAQLTTQLARQRREAGTLERDERRLAKIIDELNRMLAARKVRPVPGEKPGAPPTGSAFERLKGQLRLPVQGQVAQRYGTPRADSGMAWRGLFIHAPAGREVKAVAAGRVVFADWLRGFGNLLILDHGDGFMSLYGNNETLVGQLGNPVRAGDTIATVGASGGNEIPGLYFELRYQGKPFDPSDWLNVR